MGNGYLVVLIASHAPRKGTVHCVRAQERQRALAFFAAALAVGIVIGAGALVATAQREVAEGRSTPRVTEAVVLGDGMSLSDLVSKVYDDNRTPVRPGAGKVENATRSGLLKQQSEAKPKSLGIFSALFGNPVIDEPPLEVEPAPVPVATYRTLCVRLCDGAFFPISAATTRDRFRKDEQACQSRCGAPTKLFVYETASGSPETMHDLDGRPYLALETAFKYRVAYDPACKCQAHPWEPEAQARHQRYAELEAAKGRSALPPDVVADAAPEPPARAKRTQPVRRIASVAQTVVLDSKPVLIPPPAASITSPKLIPKPSKTAALTLGAGKMQLGAVKVKPAKAAKASAQEKPRRRVRTADDIFRASFGR